MEKSGKEFNSTPLPGVVWKEFLEGTTLHGARFLTTDHSIVKRIFWLLWVLGMTGWFTVICTKSIIRYRQYPTATRIQVKEENQIEFPAITICDANTMQKSFLSQQPKLVQDALLTLSYFDLDKKVNFSDDSVVEELDKYNATDILLKGSPPLGSIFYCFWEMNLVPCQELFNRSTAGNSLCQTFNPIDAFGTPKYSKRPGSLGGLSLGIDAQTYEYTTVMTSYAATGIRLIVHHPTEYPDTAKEIAIAPGTSTSVAIKKRRMLGLAPPYNNSWCVDSAGRKPLTFHKYYSYSACTEQCYKNYVIDLCGCRPFTSLGDEPTCGLGTHGRCAFPSQSSFCSNVSVKETCDCYQPCDQTQYTYSVSTLVYPGDHLRDYFAKLVPELNFSYFRTNWIELKIFYEDFTYDEVVQYQAYDLNDLAATVGGQMGLFIGASLLTAVEFVDVLWQLVVILVAKYKNKPRNAVTDKSKEAGNVVTTSLPGQYIYSTP